MDIQIMKKLEKNLYIKNTVSKSQGLGILEQVGEKIERPFFAFDVYNSQYSVVFLDEDEEDPKVYLISPFLAKGGKVPLIKANGFIFSDLVNESIRRVKNNIAF